LVAPSLVLSSLFPFFLSLVKDYISRFGGGSLPQPPYFSLMLPPFLAPLGNCFSLEPLFPFTSFSCEFPIIFSPLVPCGPLKQFCAPPLLFPFPPLGFEVGPLALGYRGRFFFFYKKLLSWPPPNTSSPSCRFLPATGVRSSFKAFSFWTSFALSTSFPLP